MPRQNSSADLLSTWELGAAPALGVEGLTPLIGQGQRIGELLVCWGGEIPPRRTLAPFLRRQVQPALDSTGHFFAPLPGVQPIIGPRLDLGRQPIDDGFQLVALGPGRHLL